jgi:hypothetical protein
MLRTSDGPKAHPEPVPAQISIADVSVYLCRSPDSRRGGSWTEVGFELVEFGSQGSTSLPLPSEKVFLRLLVGLRLASAFELFAERFVGRGLKEFVRPAADFSQLLGGTRMPKAAYSSSIAITVVATAVTTMDTVTTFDKLCRGASGACSSGPCSTR